MFAQTDPLSQKMFVGLQRAYIIFTEFFIAVNLDPNEDASTKLCLSLKQMIGEFLHKKDPSLIPYYLGVPSMVCIRKAVC